MLEWMFYNSAIVKEIIMTEEFKIGDKVRYKVGEEEACKNNGHEFGKVYTIKSIFEFDVPRCVYAQFENVPEYALDPPLMA